MHRRKYITALGGSLALVSLSGCAGILPTSSDDDPEHPGGTLVVENTADSALGVTVSIVQRDDSPQVETDVPAGETVTEREFISAPEGEVVTLSAVIGDDGDPTTFDFLPGGGEDAPPEVAQLSIENSVEESATWTARPGTK